MAQASGAEAKAMAAEKSAAWVRFLVIVFNVGSYYTFLWPRGIPWLVHTVSVVAMAYGVYVLVAQPYRRFPVLTTTTWTALTDGSLITFWLLATGGFDSPYYLLWYLSLVAVTLRYDRTATWVAAVAYSVAYAALVLALGQFDGNVFPMATRITYILLQGALGAVFAHETIGLFEERVRLEQQAAETDRFRALAEASREAILIHNHETILEVNDAYCALVGRTRQELVGSDLRRLAAPESAQVAREWAAVTPDESAEGFVQRPDGALVLVRAVSRPATYQGQPARVTTVYDVTKERAETKAREEARERELQLQRLKEMDRLKTDFLNAAAHELKTPLTPLKLQMHVLRGEAAQDAGRRGKAIEILDRNLGRLSVFVEDMLDVARLEAGRLELHVAPADLAQLVQEAAETFEDLAREQGVRLSIQPGASVFASIDAKRVSQILYNLLSNAIKFTPAGGEVRVTTEQQDDHAVIVVADTGRGFAPEQASLLFQPFSQLQDPVKHLGTGLGLYISRGIAQRHQGTLEASSDGPGKGARFALRLPLFRP